MVSHMVERDGEVGVLLAVLQLHMLLHPFVAAPSLPLAVCEHICAAHGLVVALVEWPQSASALRAPDHVRAVAVELSRFRLRVASPLHDL